MNKEKFLKIITYMCLAYNKNFTQEQLDIWYSFFKDYDVDELNNAIKCLVDTEEYMPSIALIKKQIAKTKLKDIPEAEEEWQEVIKAIHSFGYYRKQEALESLSPYTAKVVGYIGFERICMASPEEQIWNKKEFIAEYNALKDKEIINLQIENNNNRLLEN